MGKTDGQGKVQILGVGDLPFSMTLISCLVFFVCLFSGKRNKTLWPDCGWSFPRGWHSCHPVLPFASAVPITEVLCLFSPRWAAEVGVGAGGLVRERGCVVVAGSDPVCDTLRSSKRQVSALRSMQKNGEPVYRR